MNQLRSSRILVLAAAAVLLGAGFVACSDDDDDGGEPAASATSSVGNGGGGDATATSEGGDGATPDPATSPAATTEPTAPPDATPEPTGAAPEGGVISVQEAITIAQQEAEGEVLDVDAGLDDGSISYEIGIGSMSIVIDAATGDILAVTEEFEDDDDIHEPVIFPENAISPLEAIAIAEEMSGALAEDLEIDDVGGTPVFVVEAGDVEYSIDVVSGEVVEIDD